MPKQTLELQRKEKEEIVAFISQFKLPVIKEMATALVYLFQAFEGKIPGEDKISRLIKTTEILERTYFPTYPMLAKHVYLRLIALYVPEARACKTWSELEAAALTSYQGLSREQYVEIETKTPEKEPGQQISVVGMQGQPEGPKRRFWQRKQKEPKEESEFKE